MRPRKPNLLYSVNTWLAYNLSIRYYADVHYVWCSPIFSARNYPAHHATPPPTSCPWDVYRNLAEEVRRGDGHSLKIAENRSGLLVGARTKSAAGIITDLELAQIEEMIGAAACADFRPLLYLIPFSSVSHLVREVPISSRAHPLSQEYIIDELPTGLFDVVELGRD